MNLSTLEMDIDPQQNRGAGEFVLRLLFFSRFFLQRREHRARKTPGEAAHVVQNRWNIRTFSRNDCLSGTDNRRDRVFRA